MKKLLGSALVLWVALAIAPAVGFADSGHPRFAPYDGSNPGSVHPTPHWRRWYQTRGERLTDVPELNAGMAGQGLALLVGGMALVIDRSRRKRA